MTIGQPEESSRENEPGFSPKSESDGIVALIATSTVFLGVIGGAMGAIRERGLDEVLSGIIPGIVAAILGVGAFFLVLGGIKDTVFSAFALIAWSNAFLAGLLGPITFCFYYLPNPLICGLVARVIWSYLVNPSVSRGKQPARARSPGLWDREMDGNRD